MTDPKAVLASLGWRVDTPARLTQAVKDFQGAWNLGPALTRDGELGPSTRAALEVSILSKAAGGGDISENFNAREFACNCGGKWDDCRRIWINRNVIRVAEQYRALVGPFTPARACRCPRENARVGGVSNSQHLYGLALDLPVYEITQADVQHLGTVSGIGIYYWQGRGYVRHVDLRHLRGSTSKPSNPATWNYGNAKSAPLTPAPAAARPTPTPTSEEDDMFTEADRTEQKYIRSQNVDIARRINALTKLVIDGNEDDLKAEDLTNLIPDAMAQQVIDALADRLTKQES